MVPVLYPTPDRWRSELCSPPSSCRCTELTNVSCLTYSIIFIWISCQHLKLKRFYYFLKICISNISRKSIWHQAHISTMQNSAGTEKWLSTAAFWNFPSHHHMHSGHFTYWYYLSGPCQYWVCNPCYTHTHTNTVVKWIDSELLRLVTDIVLPWMEGTFTRQLSWTKCNDPEF